MRIAVAASIIALISTTTVLALSKRQPPAAYPARIVIQAIQVDAVIESVALTSDGAVGAPARPADAAWFTASPAPGKNGNAIIDGHFGWSKGMPAVFDKLHAIHAGDPILVEGSDHATHTFVVRTLRTYHEGEDASAVFHAADGGAHLVLITCGGTWNKTAKSYSDRLVVFADAR